MFDTQVQLYIAVSIFVLTYLFIIIETFDRTVVALSGAALMLLLKIIGQKEAIKEIDFNTLGLLIGMMILVMITKRSGVFEYIAIKLVKIARASPKKIMIYLSFTTGLLSALLDNVTTIMLIIPITLNITEELNISPIPLIITEVFASNVGGTGTLIGDPPNIIIGSAVGLTFTDFIINNGPFVVLTLIITIFLYTIIHKKQLKTTKDLKEKLMETDEKSLIKDKVLLFKCLFVLAAVFIAFMLHGTLGFESATIAMTGGVVLLLISNMGVEEILSELEWNTILFFVGLFILVGGLKTVGAIDMLAEFVLKVTHGHLILTTISVLWVSALASAFIDNIPFVTTMIPLIKYMGKISDINLKPLWWALSLGACLGGNGTIVGASANVIACGLTKKQGYKITFKKFLYEAFPMMILTIIMATAYLYLVYLM
ncbi:membrane protein [Anaeromyces robustus]|jgi:Na+/H+ antiporter NhaD/arsenite permease-like protein|uniref:Membrane protein n=2 Tax=Anaeromyces robustus TaxID=1754192 RepID=A0A1Y1VVH3_9FUNG|nr:membrane protein [Anaeromyces robustus]ORX64764.1 membrane protein [Anaeromyces robustus]|eukprot:ORX37473.1 membrane protein [Anaeromyces robustus]